MKPEVYRVADYIADFFARKGVGTVYSLPGGGAMHLIDAFQKNEKLKQLSFSTNKAPQSRLSPQQGLREMQLVFAVLQPVQALPTL